MTQVGPVEVLVFSFPGSKFSGAIAPKLREVVDNGSVSIIDFAFIAKGEDGSIAMIEIDELEGEIGAVGEALGELFDLLNEEDLLAIAESLEPGSSAAAIVFEHTWARALAGTVQDAEGQIVFAERIPREIVQAALQAIEA